MIEKVKDYGDRSLWQIIADTLIEHGIEVYPPATKVGKCQKRYVVLKISAKTGLPGISSERIYFMFMLYIPKEEYTQLEMFESEVRKILDNELAPMILPAGETNSDYYDDNFDAHMRYFLYRANARNKLL